MNSQKFKNSSALKYNKFIEKTKTDSKSKLDKMIQEMAVKHNMTIEEVKKEFSK